MSPPEKHIEFQIHAILKFRPDDAPWLWSLARRHWPDEMTGDPSKFAEAAQAAENGTGLVVQVMKREEIEEIKNWFPKFGVFPPAVEDLRLERVPEKPFGQLVVVENG